MDEIAYALTMEDAEIDVHVWTFMVVEKDHIVMSCHEEVGCCCESYSSAEAALKDILYYAKDDLSNVTITYAR